MYVDKITPTRRQVLSAIGMMGGSAALYHAMTAMAQAKET